eukprot:g28122.t1
MGNLGGRWPPTAAFFLVDVLSCESESCWMKMDGFYTVTFLCTIIGLIWLVCTRKMIEDLQSRKLQEWKETEMSSVVPTVPKVKKSWPSPDTEDETEGEESPEGAASRGVTASGADTTVVDTAGSKTSRRVDAASKVQIQGDSFKVFDNMILLCILVSCIGMAIDSPLADPKAPMTQVIRGANYLFTALFGAEMVIKLIALGLIWSEDAYLKNGWNILDGVVVITSVVDLTVDSGTGFLKGVRILRAFRPLRIISRNQNLRVVAQTIFASLQDLFSLMVVALLFLLIFALFACAPSNPQSVALSSCPNGARDPNNTNAWVENGCSSCASDLHVSWSRAAVDTPICLGRCDPETTPETWGRVERVNARGFGGFGGISGWCCWPLTSVTQLPSVCDGSNSLEYLGNMTSDELLGRDYMQAMSRMLVLPCGGTTVNSTGGLLETGVVSCRQAFCPEGVSEDEARRCQENCRSHPFFCKETCEANEQSGACQSCRRECEAACECSSYCEPLMKDREQGQGRWYDMDAALCVEQGGRWQQALSQNFDNVLSSMLTLFEISSTEGWADVMYQACDSYGQFIEPVRNYSEWLFAPFFVVYMIFSHMFIINLSVGVIDKFMDLKQSGKRDVLLTTAQLKWLDSQRLLTATRFDVTNLHKMPWLQRKVYHFISSFRFSAFILVAIALNSALMAMQTFPSQIESWDEVMYVGKRCFSAIFTLEMMLKIYALRSAYWEDPADRPPRRDVALKERSTGPEADVDAALGAAPEPEEEEPVEQEAASDDGESSDEGIGFLKKKKEQTQNKPGKRKRDKDNEEKGAAERLQKARVTEPSSATASGLVPSSTGDQSKAKVMSRGEAALLALQAFDQLSFFNGSLKEKEWNSKVDKALTTGTSLDSCGEDGKELGKSLQVNAESIMATMDFLKNIRGISPNTAANEFSSMPQSDVRTMATLSPECLTAVLQSCGKKLLEVQFVDSFSVRKKSQTPSWSRDTTTLNVTGVTSVFRVLRLFRLMKYLKGVKKIFVALAASVPKLVNVMAILLLLLTLYSILGVSLFSTLKFSSESPQCNFKDFVQAFITLFRASTGEAWNEIMHDIARSPKEIFASGDWCTPDYLFDTENQFEALSEKCLIERPGRTVIRCAVGGVPLWAKWRDGRCDKAHLNPFSAHKQAKKKAGTVKRPASTKYSCR